MCASLSPLELPQELHDMKLSLCAFALAALAISSATAQTNYNHVIRHNTSHYWSLYMANPPEYMGHSGAVPPVPDGTRTWRVFTDHISQRREARQITGVYTWWQPSDKDDLSGYYAGGGTVNTLQFEFYPGTTDPGGLAIPDLSSPPLLTIPPTPVPVTGTPPLNFKTIDIKLSAANPVTVSGDLALCALYPTGADASKPGFMGLLPCAYDQTTTMPQSFYGFAYASGTLTHYNLGIMRTSLRYMEDQPVMNLKADWNRHATAQQLGAAWGDATYYSPLADPTWAGWSDPNYIDPTNSVYLQLALNVRAENQDGDFVVPLMNFGTHFTGSVGYLGETLEILPVDPLFTALTGFGDYVGPPNHPTGTWESILTLPWTQADPALAGSWFGFEAVLVDTTNFVLTGTTQSVWIKN
jgi:hypothetical protein